MSGIQSRHCWFLLALAYILLSLAGVDSANAGEVKNPAAADDYDHARELERTGQLDKAADVYSLITKQCPDASLRQKALQRLATVQAQLGESEKSFQLFLAYEQADMDAAKIPPGERPKLEEQQAHARYRVAMSGWCNSKTETLKRTVEQFELLVKEHANSQWAEAARKELEGLKPRYEERLAAITPDAGQLAYKEALKLKGRAQFKDACERILKEHPESRIRTTVLMLVVRMQAEDGKIEDAWRTQVVLSRIGRGLKDTDTPDEATFDDIRAEARWRVAKVLDTTHGVPTMEESKRQCEIILRDHPKSRWAAMARERIADLDREIGARKAELVEEAAIAAVLQAYGQALAGKNTDAIFTLVAPSAAESLKYRRRQLQQYFEGATYKVRRFEIEYVRFSRDRSTAWVSARAIDTNAPAEKPGETSFILVKTKDGWLFENF